MIDHIKEPFLVSSIARQTDLLGATLWRFGLGKIDACKISPINYIKQSKVSDVYKIRQPSLTVLLRDRRRDPTSHGWVV
jgi:hypothetical protein